MRIVRGLSLSWEPAVATFYLRQSTLVTDVAWSPCSKLIAASAGESVEVLDAATLNPLATFKHPLDYDHFSFSPDSRSLALFTSSELISWDIQTGGCLSEILPKPDEEQSPYFTSSFTYSKDGKMVAIARHKHFYTFDLPSRTRLGPLVVPDGKLVDPIWTHDECLRFAIMHSESIIIWEVEFTLKHPPTKVESFPIRGEVISYGDKFLFLPVLYRLAYTSRGTVQVLDVKTSKLLLKPEQASNSLPMYSFSSDGRFLALTTDAGEVHIWKESPAGYALHQQPPFLLDNREPPLLSPNGRSIIFPLDDTINLWHTSNRTLSPPSPPAKKHNGFLLAFSPSEKFAAFAQWSGNVVTILDLQSGDLRLIINTGMAIKCVGVAEGTVIVVDERKIVTWNLHGGDRTFNASDSIRTVMLDHSPYYPEECPYTPPSLSLSLSHDISRITVVGGVIKQRGFNLGVHDVTTGTCLASTASDLVFSPPFTRDGREVWRPSRYSGRGRGWGIIEGGVSSAMELKPLEETLYSSRTFLWDSIRGYKVTDDGWVLSPTRKRLLWLPHRWREDQEYRLWSGQFLGLTHRLLSEVVILEFLE